jgi:hypothetical protein
MGDLAGSHTPQLIMPSLTVPRRRPFSTTGKSLGKLKVLVTGPDGMSSAFGTVHAKIRQLTGILQRYWKVNSDHSHCAI